MKKHAERLLVVDDDSMSRELLAHHLRAKGYEVVSAAGGQEALARTEAESFDLVLLDIMMPGVGGIEVLQTLRRSHSLVDLPIIMVTARDSSGDVVEALKVGANDYLTKPIDFPIALARIRTHLLLRDLKQDLQIQKDFSESLIQSAYEMIISVDLNRCITQFNPAAEKIFGYAADEVLGRSVDFLYADPEEGNRVHALTLRENGFSGEIHNQKKDGEVFISYLSASVLRDKRNVPVGLMGISFDITEKKKLEHERQKVQKLREEFLAIASHDLKNPLTGVRGYSVLLGELFDRQTDLPPEARQYVDRIRSLSELMEKIIEDFLDFKALEDGHVRLELAPVSLAELAEAVVQSHFEYAREKKIEVRSEFAETIAPPMLADKARISQVIHNFVNNAIKFGPKGARVVVRTIEQPDAARLEVEDNGPGVPPDEMDKLFVKYARISNHPSGGEKSSGLGLAISRMLVELHDGEIGATNNPDKGILFWFRIPRRSRP